MSRLAAVGLVTSGLFFIQPAPAEAADYRCPPTPIASPVNQTVWCSLGSYVYKYQSTITKAATRQICYNFRLTAYVCSMTAPYDGGIVQACRSY